MRHTLYLAAGMSLAATTAFAQQTNPPHVDMPVGAQLNRVDTQAAGIKPVATPTPNERNAVAVTYPAPAVSGPAAEALKVKSAPVPDTPDNRRLYKPLSRGGQRTAPAAN